MGDTRIWMGADHPQTSLPGRAGRLVCGRHPAVLRSVDDVEIWMGAGAGDKLSEA